LVRRIPSVSAFLTRSANDRAPIFFMICPRWIFTVISASPSSAAICLFMRPDDTKARISRSRGARSQNGSASSRRSCRLRAACEAQLVIEWSFHHQFYRSAKTEHTAHLAFLLSWALLGFGLKVDPLKSLSPADHTRNSLAQHDRPLLTRSRLTKDFSRGPRSIRSGAVSSRA
jgi:hypothetical protein